MSVAFVIVQSLIVLISVLIGFGLGAGRRNQ